MASLTEGRTLRGTALSRRLPLLLAVLFGLLAALAVNAYIRRLQQEQAVGPMVPVVVARVGIAERSVISAAQLDVREVPQAYAHPEALHALQEAVGRVAAADFVAGEPILTSKLLARGARTGLAYAIPPGKRAITIAVSEVKGVGGFIMPGDVVDVIVTVDSGEGKAVTRTLVQGVQVLATAQEVDDRPGQRPRVVSSVTLALTPAQVETVILADETARIRFALRPAGDARPVVTQGATPAALLRAMGQPMVLGQPASVVATAPPKKPQRAPASRATVEMAAAALRAAATPARPEAAERTPPPPPPVLPPATPPVPAATPPPPPPPVIRVMGVLGPAGRQPQLAILAYGGRTHIVAVGDLLEPGLAVVAIEEGLLRLARGEWTYEVHF